MTTKLSNSGISVCRGDTVGAIKKRLAQKVMEPERKINLKYCGAAMKDYESLDNINPNEIFVCIMTDEEARKYVSINFVSFNECIPKEIQFKKTDKVSDSINKLFSNKNCPAYFLLKDDGSIIDGELTIEQNGLVDNAPFYAYYGDVTVNITNPTADEESFPVTITSQMTGLHLKEKVPLKVRESSEDVVLLVADDANTNIQWIDDSKLLFKYGIPDKSIIKCVPIQRFDDIEIVSGNLNKSGTFTKVFKAKDKRNNNLKFALKEYDIDFGKTTVSEIIARSKAFGNELINSWKLRGSDHSERIVKMLGIYRDGPNFYFSMELMQESVREVIDRIGPLADISVRKYTRQIIEGLKFLHRMKILHRNLKCSSVLLDDKDNVKLCSFGFSKYLNENSHDEIIHGLRGSRPAYCHWASPETLENSTWSVFTDVWSLGATVVEMRTGNKPYHDKTDYDSQSLIIQNREVVYDKPAGMDDETYKLFGGIIACCTMKKPEERYKPEELLKHEYLNR